MELPKKIEEIHEYPLIVNQNSLYNLSLDEFIAKSISNLNKECEIMQNPLSSSSSSSSAPMFHENLDTTYAFNKKILDDAWNEIHHPNVRSIALLPREISTTYEDLTLEEFLIRASAINFGRGKQDVFVNNPLPLMAKQDDHTSINKWQKGSSFEVSENFFESKMMMDIDCLDKPLVKLPALIQEKFSQFENDQRIIRVFSDEITAKTIERRQRRMIKNRESAARSRARKQAYTNHLQHKLLQLQTTNNWLKKRKEIEIILNSSSPRYQLRRTSSTSF